MEQWIPNSKGLAKYDIVGISSAGYWFHYLRKGDPEDDQLVQEGISSNIRTGQDAENHVRVIVSGDTGWLFVNGGYEARAGLERTGGIGIRESDRSMVHGARAPRELHPLRRLHRPHVEESVRTSGRLHRARP